MHAAGLLYINSPEIYQDSYFKMGMLYYCWQLIQKDKICALITIYSKVQYKN